MSIHRHFPSSLVLLVIAALTLFLPSTAQTSRPDTTTCRKMAAECDHFLASLPAGLQHRQAVAIREAMAGHPTTLQAIRRSRNQPPTLPTDVDTFSLTPDLMLFSRRTTSAHRRPVLLYLHGGGWTFGSINSCARFCAAVASAGDCVVAALDYRLSPEHPYPAALDDVQRACELLRREAEACRLDTAAIYVGGDSAGGNLAIAAAMKRHDLAGIIPIYPVTLVYAAPSASWTNYATGYGNDAELLLTFYDAYLGTHPDLSHDPLVSVGLAPDTLLHRLPRSLFISASRDILYDQTADLVSRLRALGAPEVIHRIYPGSTHLFITVPGQPTAFDCAVRDVVRFMQCQE